MSGTHYQRSTEFYRIGRVAEAEAEARRGIQESNDSFCFAMLALICSEKKPRWKEAEQSLGTALATIPESSYVHYIASLCWMNMGKMDKSESYVRTALGYDPYTPAHHRQFATLLAYRHEWTGALAELDIALEISPENTFALADKIKVLIVLGRREEASRVKDTLLQLEPDHESPHAKAGYLALADGDHKKAFEFYREALRINPNSAEAREGVLEALRSKYRMYRWYFAFTLWLRSKPTGLFWIASTLVFGVLRSIAETPKIPGVVVEVASGLLCLFLLLSISRYLLTPLTNITLLFNRLGRLLLNPHQRAELTSLIISFAIFFGALGVSIATGNKTYMGVTFVTGVSIFVMALLNQAREKGAMRWALFAIFLTCQLVATKALVI